MEFHFGSVDLVEPRIWSFVAMEKKKLHLIIKDDVCVDMSKTMSQFQLTKPNFIEMYYWAVRIFLIFFRKSLFFFHQK